jgi:hypothetical protein
MKQVFFIGFLLTMLCCYEAHAQRQFRKPLKSTSQSILGLSNYNIGVKLGCPWSYMQKSDWGNEIKYDGIFGYLIGISAERYLGKWSVALEGTFAQKGNKIHHETPYQISLHENGILKTQFDVAYNVATIRIPVTYYFKGLIRDDKIVPYLFAGPEIDIPLGFNLDLWNLHYDSEVTAFYREYDGPNGDHPLTPQETPFNYNGINASFVAGMGLMTKVRLESSAIFFKLDAAYNRGLLNLAVPTKEAWKWPFEKQEKRIFAHDVEVNFTIVFPIKKKLRDACYGFRR